MKKNKAQALLGYSILTALGFIMFDETWTVSFVLGPTEQLAVAFHAFPRGSDYISGVAPNMAIEQIFGLSLCALLWLTGAVGSAYAPGSARLRKVLFGLFWGFIGIVNIALFAVRSV